jgi:hypothetical protein
MSSDKRRPDRLEALERWQSSELEEARIIMTQLNAAASDKQAAVERIEGAIEEFHSLVREQALGSAPLHAETLLRMSAFNNYQQQQLQSARELHQQAARQADDARCTVQRLFEHVSVVQRLLERRQELAGKQEQRLLQKQLDEGALSRAPRAQNPTLTAEETPHGR